MADLIFDPRKGEHVLDETGEVAAYVASLEGAKKEKKPKKQLRKRGLKPFDFIINWGDTKVKCQVPADYEAIQEKQRDLIREVEALQNEQREKEAERKRLEAEQKLALESGDTTQAELAPANIMKDLDASLAQGGQIAQLQTNYSYLVVAKCVVGWDDGPWEWNKETWKDEVFDLEPDDVKELANEIAQNAIMTKAEADFLARRSFL